MLMSAFTTSKLTIVARRKLLRIYAWLYNITLIEWLFGIGLSEVLFEKACNYLDSNFLLAKRNVFRIKYSSRMKILRPKVLIGFAGAKRILSIHTRELLRIADVCALTDLLPLSSAKDRVYVDLSSKKSNLCCSNS